MGDQHGGGAEPFGKLCQQVGQMCLWSRDELSGVKHRIKRPRPFLVRLKPQQQQQQQRQKQQSRRVLLLSPPQQQYEGAAEVVATPPPAPAEAPLAVPPQQQ